MSGYAKAGAILFLVALAGMALFGAYHQGQAIKNTEWQARWSQRDGDDAQALAKAEADARALEQQRHQAIDEVQRDATQKLEQARTDADGANAAADRLREQVRTLLLASGNACSHPGVAPGGAPASNPGNLLAIVLDRSVARSRALAAVADAARLNGLACEAAYEAVRGRGR